jgi:hypothetical protein
MTTGAQKLLLGPELDLFAARLILMLLVPLAFSFFELAKLGIATEHYRFTYLPIAFSLLSIISIYLWVALLRSDQRRSFKKAFAAWSFLFAYLFSLYIMGFFGIRELWQAFGERSFVEAFASIFWMWFGYRILYHLWLLSEIPNRLRAAH